MNNFFVELAKMLILSCAVSAASVTVAKSALFRGFRERVGRRHEKLGDLVSCHYCFSHWLAFLATLVFQPRPVMTPILWLWPLDYAISAFAMVGIATLLTGAVFGAARFVSHYAVAS